jgi:hypothetical protein
VEKTEIWVEQSKESIFRDLALLWITLLALPYHHQLSKQQAAVACIDAFLGQIKYARSIVEFWITLHPSHQVPMFDLRQFA